MVYSKSWCSGTWSIGSALNQSACHNVLEQMLRTLKSHNNTDPCVGSKFPANETKKKNQTTEELGNQQHISTSWNCSHGMKTLFSINFRA